MCDGHLNVTFINSQGKEKAHPLQNQFELREEKPFPVHFCAYDENIRACLPPRKQHTENHRFTSDQIHCGYQADWISATNVLLKYGFRG